MRQDIQCLRGLAIIFVLSFHLSPNLFVNGYLGVDIFFVISGFLMAKNLTNLNLLDVHDFLKFYYKRFRRILPLYYLSIFIIVIMVHLYLPDFLWTNNNRYSLASLFLITNQLVIHDQGDYFTELIAVTLITIFGFIGFAIILDKFAFNFLFLRLWQFSAGFIALFYIKIRKTRLLPKKSETPDEGKYKFTSPINQHDLVISALSILALCMLPNVIPKLILRPLVTLATSLIIGCQSQDLRILNSKTLSYIGGISYVLYLVHWPVISIFLTATVNSYLFCIVLIFILSIVLHHLFEKQYLKLEMKGIFPLVLLLIATNAYLQYSIRNDSFWKYQYTPEQKSIIERNHETYAPLYDIETRQSKCMEKDLEVEFEKHYLLGYCRLPPGKRNTSVMLIGNSYILTFVNQIEEHFKLNYSEFRYLSIIGSYGFFASSWKLSHQALELSRKQVELHKPDVLFVLPRYMQDANYPLEENDELVEEMNSNIEFYERFTKRIYILDALPNWSENFQTLFLQNLITRLDDMELLHLNKKKADLEMKNIRRRLKMIKCNKCKVFDLSHVFLEDDKYLTFDRDTMLSYIDNTVHLNAAGVRPCDPVIKNLTREIMDSL
ncbi:hypothetical protein GCK72_017248 [Caenorhabditis remanei]|uniref:Uncharacterized protein n=1 Tax=Caenorhabditis remanei TaxID=31234 RepID=A0A6A5G6S6_CAERE|nr:hypothetical protein GCK72_017248 [Caenorhabditis remanei]KAF1750697.1 hypothetical protein GCK72_017248 [Caenorhabditis remanei]